MSARLENLKAQYAELVTPARKMSEKDINRADYLLTQIVRTDPNMKGILSSIAQQAPEHMAVDEAFLYAFNHPAVKGYMDSAA